MTSERVNIVCFKWGTMYDASYVNTLYSMVSRYLSLPFRFVCFTDNANDLLSDIDAQPLPDFPEPSWQFQKICSAWRKLALFKDGLAGLQGKVLFLDLDVVILGELDSFFEERFFNSSQVAMLENWYQPGTGQASVMAFNAGGPRRLLQQYLAGPDSVASSFRTEQNYISSAFGDEMQFFPEGWCLSYKKHVMPQGLRRYSRKTSKPDECKILVFHGRPNPPDAIAGRWGKEIPWYKRWAKPIYPAPWLANYWR